MFERRRITLLEAQAVLVSFQHIPIQRIDLDLNRALELASELDVYAYDAYGIACALRTGTSLLSLDRGQCEAARRVGVPVIDLNLA